MKLKGFVSYWKSQPVNTYDSSQVIAVLIEENDRVNKGDFMFSLWSLEEANEFTPEDIRAPFPGKVDRIFVKIGDKLAANKPLAHIYSDDFLKMEAHIKSGQRRHLKKNLTARLFLNSDTLDGFVKEVSNEDIAVILFENKKLMVTSYETQQAEISCGKVKGEYLPAEYFKDNDRLQVFIDDESTFSVAKIGTADSLVLITPPLPDLEVIPVVVNVFK